MRVMTLTIMTCAYLWSDSCTVTATHNTIPGLVSWASHDTRNLYISPFSYSMLNLKIHDDAMGSPADFSFNTGAATWIGQDGISIVDTATEQGFMLTSDIEELDLPAGE